MFCLKENHLSSKEELKPHLINPGMAREMRRSQREQTRQKKVGTVEIVKLCRKGATEGRWLGGILLE